jgi:acyl-CoA thioesterase FadM
MAYKTEWTIRFDDVDNAGMLFYPELFRVSHRAVEDLLDEAGIPIHDLLERGVGLPVVHAEADYLNPLTYGDTVFIEINADVGETSITLETTGFHDGEIAFEVTERHVYMEFEIYETQSVPEDIEDAIMAVI